MSALYVRGAISNGGASAILYSIAVSLDLHVPVSVAVGIQLLVFALHGLPQRSEKFYDLSGSCTHLAVVLSGVLSAQPRSFSARQIVLALSSVVWMTRLGTFLYGRILKDGKDERFDKIKPVWLSFMGAWMLQAAWCVMIQLPVLLLNSVSDTTPIGALDVVLMLAWFASFLIEATADVQKSEFRNLPENKTKFITSGLWAYSRHPNYFGEILMWTTHAAICSYAALQLPNSSFLHAAWISPLFTAFLLLCVSGVPMVEKAGMKKWGENKQYLDYVNRTSCVIPWFPSKA
jgi:steroid 5-alpha reductase family enzyme